MSCRKIAIDIHGVIDKSPDFFRAMCKDLVETGWQVHILTGRHKDTGIIDELVAMGFYPGFQYTHFFSISDYHKEIGTQMWGDTANPWMDDTIWSKTKAEYCKKNDIGLCLDDTDRYIPHFETPVARYYSISVVTKQEPIGMESECDPDGGCCGGGCDER